MSNRNRSQLILGILLILTSIVLIYLRVNPEIAERINKDFTWPLWIIIGAVLLLILGLILGEPEMAIPASIISGIGGILYYQNLSGDWSSWMYIWTLIPGFVGIGRILAGLFGSNFKESLSEGIRLLLISSIMFLIGITVFGKGEILGTYRGIIIPGLLLFTGLWFLYRGLKKP